MTVWDGAHDEVPFFSRSTEPFRVAEVGRCQRSTWDVGPRCCLQVSVATVAIAATSEEDTHARTRWDHEAHEFLTILGRTWLGRMCDTLQFNFCSSVWTVLAQCGKVPRSQVSSTLTNVTLHSSTWHPWFSQVAHFSVRAHPS